jgi:hypothetical protein
MAKGTIFPFFNANIISKIAAEIDAQDNATLKAARDVAVRSEEESIWSPSHFRLRGRISWQTTGC